MHQTGFPQPLALGPILGGQGPGLGVQKAPTPPTLARFISLGNHTRYQLTCRLTFRCVQGLGIAYRTPFLCRPARLASRPRLFSHSSVCYLLLVLARELGLVLSLPRSAALWHAPNPYPCTGFCILLKYLPLNTPS